jgi:methylated-DNA-[protein]-cysteine S-methyltransferase
MGPITVVTDKTGALTRLDLLGVGDSAELPKAVDAADDDPVHARIHHQLHGYFSGERQVFDLPLRLEGTPFRQKVWKALREVPFGRTVTYGELARTVGSPGAARAVGGACGNNPIPLVVPCHRVLASIGIGGWSAAPGLKEALLAHERVDLTGLS